MKVDILYRYFNLGQGIKKIANETGKSKNTVKKYINEFKKQNECLLQTEKPYEIIEAMQLPPRYDISKRKPTVVTDEILDKIKKCIDENQLKIKTGRRKLRMTNKDIHEYLENEGFHLSYPTVCNYVRKLSVVTKEAFIKQLYKYGEVCEFDWGDVELQIDGINILYKIAVFTSAKTNIRYAILYRNENTQCFVDSHSKFFKKFGIFHTMVYDNMRVAVARFVGKAEKEPTDALKQLSTYYGFHFRFCNIRAGNEKGHVENSVDFIRRKAFSFNNKFDTEDFAILHLEQVLEKINSDKSPEWDQEQKYLLPQKPQYSSVIRQTGIVDKLSCISYKQNKYSVPDYLVGKVVNIKIYPQKINVYYNEKLVAEHKRSYKNHDFILDIMHYRSTLSRKPGAIKDSVAFSLMCDELKDIYKTYFTDKPKEFIFFLNIVAEFNLKKAMETIEKLRKIGVKVNYDNIKLSLTNTPVVTPHFKQDEIEITCTNQILRQNQMYFGGVM